MQQSVLREQERRKTSIDYYTSTRGGLLKNYRFKPDKHLHTGSVSDRQAEYDSG